MSELHGTLAEMGFDFLVPTLDSGDTIDRSFPAALFKNDTPRRYARELLPGGSTHHKTRFDAASGDRRPVGTNVCDISDIIHSEHSGLVYCEGPTLRAILPYYELGSHLLFYGHDGSTCTLVSC